MFCCITLSSGCINLEYFDFFSKKKQGDANFPIIESETLPPPVSEYELSNVKNIPVPSTDYYALKVYMIGAWKMSYQDTECDVILTLTKFKKNFRGTSRDCYGKLALLSAWNIVDDQLELKNFRGDNIIVLDKIDDQHFEGRFSGKDETVYLVRKV
ncbi:AprI/Inh family metalloprotease inhibitor [Candidatus Liberibacter americanus]|uniref:AprI/Inh family metalloprotease inhibitor n=1 Tax=Candidatus Liberibacter americanus TaxID=309868 RepID=UPI001F0AC976|nr:AprI/Inh family metalloprotease inhibitor [Candidatus Liberibacter americanus]